MKRYYFFLVSPAEWTRTLVWEWAWTRSQVLPRPQSTRIRRHCSRQLVPVSLWQLAFLVSNPHPAAPRTPFLTGFWLMAPAGNLITLLALLKSPTIREHATTAFVISLSISDLLFCSFSLPLTAVRYFQEVSHHPYQMEFENVGEKYSIWGTTAVFLSCIVTDLTFVAF